MSQWAENIQMEIYAMRGRVTWIGRCIIQLAAFLSAAGAFGCVATTLANKIPAVISRQPETSKTLANIYTGLPTWWIPETLFGLSGLVILTIIGISILQIGRQIDRFHDSY